MKYNILYLLLSLFSTFHTMDPFSKDSIWVKTNDKHCIEVSQAIAQQSNLLTVLQEKYTATKQDPIPVPISEQSFNCFRINMEYSGQELIQGLTDKAYHQLMDTTVALKCPIFYAELIEQLIPERKITEQLARLLNLKYLNKKISRFCERNLKKV